MADAALDVWEGRSVDEWQARWRIPELVVLDTTTSTNDELRARAECGAAAGTLVLAEHQSAGRGRMGRTWHDQPARSLLFSVLLRPGRTHNLAPGTVPLRVGLAVARTLAEHGAPVLLKWPNDVVSGERKVAGILCEALTTGADTVLIAGVGINVSQRSHDFAGPLRAQATSLDLLTGRATDRAALMSGLVAALAPLFTMPLEPLSSHEQAAFATIDALAGREVHIRGDVTRTGLARGIAPDGALRVEIGGAIVPVMSGTVRPTGPASSRLS